MPRGRGVLMATGATLGLVGLLNLVLSTPVPPDAGAPAFEALLGVVDRLPLVALGAGLLSFGIVRDPGPLAGWIAFAALAVLAAALLGASVLLGAALPVAWSDAAGADDRGRLELVRGAVLMFLYTVLFLYLAFAVWRSRIRTA